MVGFRLGYKIADRDPIARNARSQALTVFEVDNSNLIRHVSGELRGRKVNDSFGIDSAGSHG